MCRVCMLQLREGDKDKSGKRKKHKSGEDEDDKELMTHRQFKKRY